RRRGVPYSPSATMGAASLPIVELLGRHQPSRMGTIGRGAGGALCRGRAARAPAHPGAGAPGRDAGEAAALPDVGGGGGSGESAEGQAVERGTAAGAAPLTGGSACPARAGTHVSPLVTERAPGEPGEPGARGREAEGRWRRAARPGWPEEAARTCSRGRR